MYAIHPPPRFSPNSCHNLKILPGDTSSLNLLRTKDKGPLTRPFKLSYSSVVHELPLKNKLGAQAYDHAHAHALGNAMGCAKAKA